MSGLREEHARQAACKVRCFRQFTEAGEVPRADEPLEATEDAAEAPAAAALAADWPLTAAAAAAPPALHHGNVFPQPGLCLCRCTALPHTMTVMGAMVPNMVQHWFDGSAADINL